MSENYIVINGKRAELTEEQMKALGIEVKKDPFERAKGDMYYCIAYNGNVVDCIDADNRGDGECFVIANYCTDKALMEQRALHETLNRLLWRYSMQHDEGKVDWDGHDFYKICFDHDCDDWGIDSNDLFENVGVTYFRSRKTAEAAIEEVVKPFIEQHPEFKW